MKLICFAKSRGEAASTRQRVLGLIEVAKQQGWDAEMHWVPGYPRWNITPRRIIRLWRYYRILLSADADTVVLLQRTLRCPEFLWLVRRMRPVLRYVISDFDDAVWQHSPKGFLTLVKLADEVWCGSQVIMHKVLSCGVHPVFLPTTINTALYDGVRSPESVPVIGWVGSGRDHLSNLTYFAGVLKKIAPELPSFRLRIIGAGSSHADIAAAFSFLGDRLDIIDWLDSSAIPEAISAFSIGIMPLSSDAFNAGKCGLKLLEYAAAGVPVIASDIGENALIVQPPSHGLLVSADTEWKDHIETLLSNPLLGEAMGKAGRLFVCEKYDRFTVYSGHLARLRAKLS